MAKKQRRVNRRKKQQLEVVKTSTGMEEFAKSTADLVTKLCKLAHDSEMTDIAFESFRHQIQEVLDEQQRDLLHSLMSSTAKELESIWGCEKSSSNGPNENDPNIGTSAEPEPPPKEEEKPKEKTVTDIAKRELVLDPSKSEVSLLGFGISFYKSPTKHAIDDCLKNPDRLLTMSTLDGFLSKHDIATEIGAHPDTVRKRIAEIKKNSTFLTEGDLYNVYKIGDTGTGLGLYLLEHKQEDGQRFYKIQTTTSE